MPVSNFRKFTFTTAAWAMTFALCSNFVDAKTIWVEIENPEVEDSDTLITFWQKKNLKGRNYVTWLWKLESHSKTPTQKDDYNPDLPNPDAPPDPKNKQPLGVKSEDKFTKEGDNYSGRTFTGISEQAKTTYATITATGSGSSTVTTKKGKTAYRAAATISLKGVKPKLPQNPPVPIEGSYKGIAGVNDPFAIFAEDVTDAGLDPTNVNLYLPFGLLEAEASVVSDVGFSAYFEKPDGRQGLFDLTIGAYESSTGLFPSSINYDISAEYYLLSDSDDEPDFASDAPLDMTAFSSALMADLAADGKLGTQLYFGVVLPGTDLTGAKFNDGASALWGYEASTGAYDLEMGLIPLPPSGFLLIGAILPYAALRRRRRLS